ncbi:hypothetical protein [Desnuesiella massiliensis]|uniref:hypothetical protein n=1 Tax=Desnuesiella massiliensis TaxID=1650662 RepID=UPI0012B557F7|nr:hypothetical protein [Desnuesiella massiliensis]
MLIKWFKIGAIVGLIFCVIGMITEKTFDWTYLIGFPIIGGFVFVAIRKWFFRTFWS